MASSFHIDFNIKDYKDLLPDPTVYLKNDFVINGDQFEKGNIDNCIWTKPTPSLSEITSSEFQEREARRILKTGVYIAIKDQLLWLNPQYYFSLAYGKAGSSNLQFRLNRLKLEYHKIQARANGGCMGTLVMKGRGAGETTQEIINAFWECLDGNIETGQIGIQSINRQSAINPCWSYVQTLWQSLPQWLKNLLCSDFVSGNNIAEKMQWQRNADENSGIKARNVRLAYYPSGTPMDGMHDVLKVLLDEICKWEECSFYETFTNYKKFIMPGFERRGMFSMFSSPAQRNIKSNEEVYQLFQDSNMNEIDSTTGTTKSRIHRYFLNPLEGIHGSYDKWGDADPQRISDHIMAERKKVPKDKLLAEIRGFPLNEQEMFESTDSSEFWSNHKGINARKIYLIGTRFKNTENKEPKVVYGNLEWKDGIKDHIPLFRQSDKSEFDIHEARFCFSYFPKEITEPMSNIFTPPLYIENCIGIDSVDKRYAGKKPSNFAMVNHKFRDLANTGIVKCPTMIYLNRPQPIEIAYEDAIKACVFLQASAQVESLNSKIIDYFEDRGYIDWLLSKLGQPRNSLQKGDAPSGKSAFIDEIVGMLDALYSVPLKELDLYPLELNWFYELLDDVSRFNLKDTHANDLTMAQGQSLLGSAKLLFKKVQQRSEFNDALIMRQLAW
jgi:hypothetical protein